MTEASATLPPLRIGYAYESPAVLLAQPDVLAVIGFGNGLHETRDPRHIRIGLEVLGKPAVEVWRAGAPVRHGRDGLVHWSSDGDYGFFAVEVEEHPGQDGLAAAAEQAYRVLTQSMHASPTPHVLRLWNYFDAINLGAGDEERYRRFCVGRARGIAESWRDFYPAATAIGRSDGVRVLQVYALTSRSAGVPVENPRQVNAWLYPRQYGPTPPTFARGMATVAGQLLISGTAAVVGSASRHQDDVAAQLDETLKNIDSLIGTAHAGARIGAAGLFKVYVRDRDDAALVAKRLGDAVCPSERVLILRGDICRRELLVEIDGIHA